MATYAVGDLQGCYRELLDLLDLVGFAPERDRLWFTGDLVNRGPESLQALRFVRDLGESAVTVLGNHDLHLLAVAAGTTPQRSKDTLDDILEAPDRAGLLRWLADRPLFHADDDAGFIMVHAGLPPQWDRADAAACAAEVEAALSGPDAAGLYREMYGDGPRSWSGDLGGAARLRFIINCLTRMRFCDADGRVSLEQKGPPGVQSPPFLPWYEVPTRRTRSDRIIFGHWSTVRLGGETDFSAWNVFPLDTGCVWGGTLTALRLEDLRWFSVPSRQPKRFD